MAKSEMPYIGKHMTSVEVVGFVEAFIRDASVPGLFSRLPPGKRAAALTALFADACERAKDGYFVGTYIEYELAFGISATLNVDFDYVSYETETGRFGNEVKKFIRSAPRVTVNAPSMNKTVEQAVVFANLLTDVAKLAASINVALKDAVLVKFVEEK